jgi:prepilin-type N-terminal cleavage/methylation domain-containing protein
MTSNLKARLLQHFINKKKEGGFTLIELLVVIIIIGILAAIALPSFLNQANRARESEANTYVGSVNRGQQAYRLENSSFATEFGFLEVSVGVSTSTDDITVSDAATERAGEFYLYALDGPDNNYAAVTATPNDTNLHPFRGCVNAVDGQSSAEIKKADDPGTTAVTACDNILNE